MKIVVNGHYQFVTFLFLVSKIKIYESWVIISAIYPYCFKSKRSRKLTADF